MSLVCYSMRKTCFGHKGWAWHIFHACSSKSRALPFARQAQSWPVHCALGSSFQCLTHAANASICSAACAVVYAERCEFIAYAVSPKCVASRELLGPCILCMVFTLLLGCAGALLLARSAAASNRTSGSSKCASHMYCSTSQHHWCSLS